MKNIKSILGFIIVAAVLSTGCKKKNTQRETQTVKIDTVQAFILKKSSFNKKISFPGELVPLERAEIFAKIPGYLKSLKVDIGDEVRKGEVIATLDAPEVLSGYSQVNSDVQSAKSRYLESLDVYRRFTNAAKVEGTVATGELERSRNQMLADSAALESLKSRLEANAQLKNYLIIRAPFRGTVTRRNFDPGTLIGTGNTKPLMVIEDNSSLRLRLPVPEAYSSANPEGMSASFMVEAFPGKVFRATLSRKAGAMDLNNRTETWEFIYSNRENQLKSGMFASATINFSRPAPSFVVPATAIITNLEKRFVIRLKNGLTEWVDVHNGVALDDKTEIFGSLSEGDTILVRGSDEIKQNRRFVPEFKVMK